MNKLMVGLAGAAMVLSSGAAFAKPWVVEEAHVPAADGVRAVALVKDGARQATVMCHDSKDAIATFHPQAIAFGLRYNAAGKPRTTEDVIGTERIVPVSVDNCTVNGGNQFDQDVATAQTRS